jgi:hypothetical protein
MLAFMILYTVSSLGILSQPIVEENEATERAQELGAEVGDAAVGG